MLFPKPSQSVLSLHWCREFPEASRRAHDRSDPCANARERLRMLLRMYRCPTCRATRRVETSLFSLPRVQYGATTSGWCAEPSRRDAPSPVPAIAATASAPVSAGQAFRGNRLRAARSSGRPREREREARTFWQRGKAPDRQLEAACDRRRHVPVPFNSCRVLQIWRFRPARTGEHPPPGTWTKMHRFVA